MQSDNGVIALRAALAARHENGRTASQDARRLAEALVGGGGADWRRDGAGRPFVIPAGNLPGPDVSLSHSGGWVAAGMARNGRVGIDVEDGRKARSFLPIAQTYFSPAEIESVRHGGGYGFYACWTLREAAAKCLGGGLAQALAFDDGDQLLKGQDGHAILTGPWGAMLIGHRGSAACHVALAWSVNDAATFMTALDGLAAAIGPAASL